MNTNVQRAFRASGYNLIDVTKATLALWFSVWCGIVFSGAVAGLFWGIYASQFSALDSENTLVFPRSILVGSLLAGAVGSITTSITCIWHCISKRLAFPENAASICGGLTAALCMPLLAVVTVPLGCCGAWIAARLFLKSRYANPLRLFNELLTEESTLH